MAYPHMERYHALLGQWFKIEYVGVRGMAGVACMHSLNRWVSKMQSVVR